MSKLDGNHQRMPQGLSRHSMGSFQVLAERVRFKLLARTLSAILVFAASTSIAIAASETVEAPSSFKYAGGDVPEWPAGAHERPENGAYSVAWKYPVFSDKNAARLGKLNGWARTVALTALFQGEPETSRRALAMKDSRVLAELGRDKAFRGFAGTQSELVPDHVFGPYVLFTLHSEWLGAARPQHGIETLVFDYEAGVQFPVQSLFKAGAQEELNSLLGAAIEKSFRDDKRAYAVCLKSRSRDPKLVCERQLNDDDMNACVNWRSFDWSLLSIGGPQKLFLTFPFNPGWRQTCGDEAYALEGKAVERLFAAPNLFRKGRMPKELKP
jgi:hypothetical protein